MDADLLYIMTYCINALVCAVVTLNVLYHLSMDISAENEKACLSRFLVFYLVFVISNAVCAFNNTNHLAVPGYISSIVNEVALVIAVYYWFLYIEVKLGSAFMYRPWFKVVSRIPALITAVIVMSTPWTKMVFYYTDEGIFVRGSFYLVFICMGLVYLFMGTMHIVVKVREEKNPYVRKRYLLLMTFILFPMTAGLVDFFVPGIPIVEMMALLGIVVIFTGLQQADIQVDSTTGLYNRKYIQNYLYERKKLTTEYNPLIYIVMDIDGLGDINENYSHKAGNEAIQLTAETLEALSQEMSCRAARWGRDDFVVIIQSVGDMSPGEFMDHFNTLLKENARSRDLGFDVKISMGYEICTDSSMRVSEITRNANRMLAQVKKNKRMEKKGEEAVG